MKQLIKKFLPALLIVAFVASVGFNLYALGWAKIVKKYQQEGFNACAAAVIKNIDERGSVTIGNRTFIEAKTVQTEVVPQTQP